jgi:hypothetical protein
MLIISQNRAHNQKYTKHIIKYSLTIFKYISHSIVNRALTIFTILRINYIKTLIY